MNFKTADKAAQAIADGGEREIVLAYRRALKEIQAKVAALFEKYEQNGKLTLGEISKYNRLTGLESAITDALKELGAEQVTATGGTIRRVYRENYYRTMYEAEKGINANISFARLDADAVKEAIANPLDRIGWRGRSADMIRTLNSQVRSELTQGIIQGKSYPQIAKMIKDRLNVGVSKAVLIARTETHRVQVKSRIDSIGEAESAAERLGIKVVKKWRATLDSRTRSSHQHMDGKTANKDGLFNLRGMLVEGPGLTGIAAEDINCRCGIVMEVEGNESKTRIARNRETGKNELIEFKNYDEWAAQKGIRVA